MSARSEGRKSSGSDRGPSRLKLVVLGSGTCVPCVQRHAPGYLLVGAGRRLLVDCGSGTLWQLERAKGSYRSLDAVCITHAHPDHVADLGPLLQALSATPGLVRREPLLLLGSAAARAWLEQAYPRPLAHAGFGVCHHQMPANIELGSLRIRSVATRHAAGSVAYRFETETSSLVITGDAEYDDALAEFARGAALLVADCSFPDRYRAAGHMSASDCGRLAQNADVGRLLLSHLYPFPDGDELRLRECRAVYRGLVELAQDLAEIEV